MEKSKKPVRMALGRGLSSLISSNAVPVIPMQSQSQDSRDKVIDISLPSNQGVKYVNINSVLNNRDQPRQYFSHQELEELSASIKQLGVLQPVLVRPSKISPDGFEIIAGERRWRAAKLAGLTQLPVIVRDFSDQQSLEVALVENVQRENLNPIEQAKGYQRLIDEFSLSQEMVADRVGKDRTTVANSVRLLKLPREVQELVAEGKISTGHAKALLSIKDVNGQSSLAKKIVAEALSVRDLEGLISRVVVLDGGKPSVRERAQRAVSQTILEYSDASERLRRALGTKVTIRPRKGGKGSIEIEYFSAEELDRLLETICGGANPCLTEE